MRQAVLRHDLDHRPEAADFEIVQAPAPVCPEAGLLIKVQAFSLDPYIGSRIRGRHMGEPTPRPGIDAIHAHGVGQVIESQSPAFKPGDWVHCLEAGWREIAPAKAEDCRKIDISQVPAETYLGVLGMPGLTAWAGITQRARIGQGDVVLVDAAAGPVGGTVGQIARLKGARKVIGIAGGADKCALVRERYGFDDCIDYKSEGWTDQLETVCAGELSVHFENVSTQILTLALAQMAPYGRVVLCGLAAQYHADTQPQGIPTGLIIAKRAELYGLVVYDFYPRWQAYWDEALDWVRSGKLAIAEDRANGLDEAPALFERLMRGQNMGKALVVLGA